MNTTLDPIPNPLAPFTPVMTRAQAQTALQTSFDQWNNLPSSYIDMQITKTVANPGLRGFDMINELTFRTAASFTAIASSPSTNFIEDVTLVNGDQIDNDADADVSSAITTAQDVDNDGDIELPAGFYKAGTIIDNDVQFNTKTTNGLRFTLGDPALDTVGRSVDLNTVATHEFGHSHGLSHSMDNQISAADGTGATMYPFIDTGDPASEAAQRTLSADDIAWSSYFYQEGTAASGPPALQPGDVAFNKAFGLITGNVQHGVQNLPLAGASVAAYNWDTGALVASGFSGTTQLAVNPNTGQAFLISAAYNIIDGKYTIPVAKGNYSVGIEPVDGIPVPTTSISFTTQIGGAFGQNNFNEEFYNNNAEAMRELRLGQRKNVNMPQPGRVASGINITTADSININNFGNRTGIGFGNPLPAGFLYAIRIPASQITAINPGGDILIQGVTYDTIVVDDSVPAIYANAYLTTGVVSPDTTSATINLVTPLQQTSGFLGQNDDFAPFHFQEPHDLGRTVLEGINNGSIQNLFIVLQVPTTLPYPGVSGQPPLVGLSNSTAPNLFSYQSADGGVTWVRRNTLNFRFSLITSLPVNP